MSEEELRALDRRVAEECMKWHPAWARVTAQFSVSRLYARATHVTEEEAHREGFGTAACWADAEGRFQGVAEQWRPTERIEQAWEVVEALNRRGYRLFLNDVGPFWRARFEQEAAEGRNGEEETAALAIVRAALKCVGQEGR